jgi:nucleoside-diphosphate-sugar epimerase
MKIFLTGGTGFIGSNFINYAHRCGVELICLKRENSEPRVALEKSPNWIIGTIDQDLTKILAECDVLVHLASHSTNVPYDTLENCLEYNLFSSLKLLNQARNAGVQKFIVSGTGFEYGKSGERYLNIPFNAPLEPTMTYPASKAAASIVFYQWALENNLLFKYLRIFQVYGNGEDKNRFWPSLKRAAQEGLDFSLTSGEQVRDFINVKDLVKLIFEELNFDDCQKGYPLFKNIGFGKAESLKEFANYWWGKWNAKGKLRFGEIQYRKNEIMRFVPSVNKNKNNE